MKDLEISIDVLIEQDYTLSELRVLTEKYLEVTA